MSSISLTQDIKNSVVANGTAAQTKPTMSSQAPNITSTDIEMPPQLLRRAANILKLTAIEQFKLNEEWTDYLQKLVDYGNKHLLKDFQYRFIMEEV